MKKAERILSALTAVCIASSLSVPMYSAADEIIANDEVTISESAQESGYQCTVNGDIFSFYDNVHGISIIDGMLKNGRDISFYGLNNDGNLAVVYYNAIDDEGKSAVISNDSMIYTTYADGGMSEVERSVGTLELFGFDLSNADSSMEGMMKVFNASLGSFIQSYGASIMDYTGLCTNGTSSGAVQFVKADNVSLTLMDDNYITNSQGSSDETFMANEWGIYSGYRVIDGVDYNTFCFFGNNNDAYFYGYAATESGFKVVNMKGSVSAADSRTKIISFRNIDMSRTSDSASQYITKLAGCLMGAQGYPSLNLDTISLVMSYKLERCRLVPVIVAKTDTAYGILKYSNGVYSGTLKDSNGNSEELSVKANCRSFVVTTKTSGSFTVANRGLFGTLKLSDYVCCGRIIF